MEVLNAKDWQALSVRLDKKLYEQLRKQAFKDKKSINKLTTEALIKFLEK